MKKLFMSLAALIALGASAETVTLTPTGINDGVVATGNSDFTLTALQNKGTTAPAFNTNGNDLRVYAKGTLEIEALTGINITKVVFNISTAGLKRLAPITASEGTIATQAKGDKTVTWTGNANSIIFTVGDKADFGSESGKAGQFDISTIDITYSAGAVDPDAIFAPVISFDDSNCSVSLTCASEGVEMYYTLDGTDPTATSTHYIAPFEVEKSCTVKAIAIKGEKTSTVASLDIVVPVSAKSIAEMLALAPNNNNIVKVGCPLTVTYANGKYVYVVDAAGDAVLLFDTNTFETGDIIPAGWEATYVLFNGIPEFTGTFPAASGKAEVTYETVESVSTDDLSKVLWLNKVTFEEATPDTKSNFEGVLSDGTALNFYNNFTVSSVEPGEYCVKVAVSMFKEKLQVCPIEYAAIADEAPYDVYVIGADVNGASWTEGDPSGKMTYVGNGIFEWTGEKLATGFKFNDGSWSGQLNIGGDYGSATLGIPYNVKDGGSNIELSDFFGYILTDAKIVFDTNNMTIVVTGTKTAVVVDWYFASSINEFTLDDSCKMSTTSVDGVYELANINIEDPGTFKITTAGWAEQYGMGEAITDDHLFTTLAKVNYGGDVEFNVAQGEYSIKWDFNTSTVTFTLLRATGVEGIAADSEDAVYYNLQGVKVANPTNGIYVKVVGNNAQKVNICK